MFEHSPITEHALNIQTDSILCFHVRSNAGGINLKTI